MRRLVCLSLALAAAASSAQERLTVDLLMQRPEAWIGGWPADPHWTTDGRHVYFQWNPQGRYEADSLFAVPAGGGAPVRAEVPDAPRYDPADARALSPDGRLAAGVRDGDLFVTRRESGETTRLTRTPDAESAPAFLADGRLAYVRAPATGPPQLVALTLATGATDQLTDFRAGTATAPAPRSRADSLLAADQRRLFGTLRAGARRDSLRAARRAADHRAERPPTVYLGTDVVEGLSVDPSGRFVTFRRRAAAAATNTRMLRAVTASGYAEAFEARPKVGEADRPAPLFVTDLSRDTTMAVRLATLPGADSTDVLTAWGPVWSPTAPFAVLDVRTRDNRDRWIVTFEAATGAVAALDHQTDAAWLGGPGVSSWGGVSPMGWLPDPGSEAGAGSVRVWYHTERSGWGHLAAVDVETGQTEVLTEGPFEVDDAVLTPDGEAWLFESSEGDTGQRHVWTMPVGAPGRAAEAFAQRRRLTGGTGRWDAALSPDGRRVAYLHSTSNRPPEVYVGRWGETPVRITDSPTAAWLALDWPEAEIVHVPASDGAGVPARIYRPETPNGAAVLFVHGAGYLQNAHRWWSQYFREAMFHRLLAERGYVVLDLDYRASAGLGRDWRTAVAGHMGGRDLQDYVDASRWLGAEFGIAPERVGIYGGSYGGFLTLMALFTEGEHFGAGAALRSVTDWAHYNDGYTRNILGDPADASAAYRRSSPVWHAEGLTDPLLMIHGLVDDNVQPQDIFRLTQRLVELGKTDWELAIHPVEAHGYTEPASWADAYRRILALFERTIGTGEGR